MKQFHCKKCGTLVLEIVDGKVKRGAVVYCAACVPKPTVTPYIPDFLKGMAKKKHDF